MKRLTRIYSGLCALLMASAPLTSCLNDDTDDQVTTYSDVAITQFTLGTLNRYATTTSLNTGNDTVVKTTVAGTSYPMTIDQLGRKVYNRKALPMGTDVKHVLVTISTRNNGLVALQSMTSDSLSWFNTKDSVDFSVPRTFRVYAVDGSAWRDYSVTLTVSDNKGVDFAWQRNSTVSGIADNQQLVAFGDTVRMAPRGVITRGQRAWRIGTQGYVETSDDLSQWRLEDGVSYENAGLSRLIGASSYELYALAADGRLMVCTDEYGATWREEQLDDAATLLPDDDIAMVSWPYSPVDNTDYVLMAGSDSRLTGDDAAYASIWRKLSTGAPAAQWVYMPLDDANRRKMPASERLSMAIYEDAVLAVGSDLTVRQSRDQGITWPVSTTYALPTTLQAAWVSLATDGQGRLWLLTDQGELWQGERR